MERILVSTSNPDKLREIRLILADVPVEVLGLGEVGPVDPPEETGATFAENARQKALAYAAATGLVAVAEDSGLEIDALDGAPGVYSARFGGETSPYPEKFALIYRLLKERGVESSRARFVCALAVAEGPHILFEARGAVEGVIAPAPRGARGFGYDPIFHYPPFGCTLAEVTSDRKSSVSHRGMAFRQLREFLARAASRR